MGTLALMFLGMVVVLGGAGGIVLYTGVRQLRRARAFPGTAAGDGRYAPGTFRAGVGAFLLLGALVFAGAGILAVLAAG